MAFGLERGWFLSCSQAWCRGQGGGARGKEGWAWRPPRPEAGARALSSSLPPGLPRHCHCLGRADDLHPALACVPPHERAHSCPGTLALGYRAAGLPPPRLFSFH